jgi:hypothetical protein
MSAPVRASSWPEDHLTDAQSESSRAIARWDSECPGRRRLTDSKRLELVNNVKLPLILATSNYSISPFVSNHRPTRNDLYSKILLIGFLLLD